MSDVIWETFNGLFVTLHKQGRRVEELETRLCELERRLAERDAETNSALRLISERQARTTAYVSELRYKMGLTEVDEVAEQFDAEEFAKAVCQH